MVQRNKENPLTLLVYDSTITINFEKAPRQDSKVFTPRVKGMHEERGINYTQEASIYSDRLDFKRAKELNEQCLLLGFKCTSSAYFWLRFVV
ncbi:uncharacterized protein BJ212DRAFT_932576 [Suillus subaureus]|uniref:Uncharacterized protein n=1 Tax=Suillus subaureus TaxID=48587 RepID=A0A9P7JH92_9AGAM|nr:uncharacterized protein BJ212DRAFT_932576 [Suillus subaureus]KAG1821966.1 hypothetical protein BJ212DRAFT_932576 [Suillus subaureus]